MKFSFSRINLYQTCPRRFYFKYILGMEECITKPLALGKAVHKAIEKRIDGTDFENAIAEGYIECDFHPEVTYEEVSKLVKSAPIFKKMGETEVYFCLPLSNSPDSPELQGYIDLVIGNKLVDWKTNWKPYDVTDNHQLELYAWALSKQKGYEVVEGSLFFLRFKKESKTIYTYSDMEQARQWALELANEINSKTQLLDIAPERVDDIFPYKPSSACSHCPFVLDCYLQNNRKGVYHDKNGTYENKC